MKKKILKISLLVLVGFFLGSCNRGVGCPNQFSLSEMLGQWMAFLG